MISAPPACPRAVRLGAVLFGVAALAVSWWHWWTFQYTSFDLAFYVQALWLALQGKWQVSLLGVPLMGNHAEPIVFLLLPFFAVWSHPMLPVIAQVAAMATMPCTAWRIATRLGFTAGPAALLALLTVLTPSTFLVAIYEFHPEALAAPLLLLLIEARLAERRGWFWLWFVAVLSVKENMALLLVAWCVTFAVIDWRRRADWVRWNVWPGLAAALWLVLCGKVIGPWLNAGNVDYLELYRQHGASAGEIVRRFITDPLHPLRAIGHALRAGNLVWALLLPMLALPLLRPRWWFIAAPLLLQHLLSVRPSEWSIGAHYPAPLIPLLWIAAVEVLAKWRAHAAWTGAMTLACLVGQAWVGALPGLIEQLPHIPDRLEARAVRAELLAQIPVDASVMAVQPALSHLAKRERLLSLHHTLKGLKTLSRAPYETPAPTDVVVIDYEDQSTFNVAAGYFHPEMRTKDGRFVPASLTLLHEFLSAGRWTATARNAVTLLRKGEPSASFASDAEPQRIAPGIALRGLQIASGAGVVHVRLNWQLESEREHPWLMLVLEQGQVLRPFLKGACAIEAGQGAISEQWSIALPRRFSAGEYRLHAVFFDGTRALWDRKMPPLDSSAVLQSFDLGVHRLEPRAD